MSLPDEDMIDLSEENNMEQLQGLDRNQNQYAAQDFAASAGS
jgi:hypothetical protein